MSNDQQAIAILFVAAIAICLVMAFSTQRTSNNMNNLANQISATQNQISELRNETRQGQ